MANTYTQINIHAIFAVQGRENYLKREIRKRIFEYISGIIKGMGLFPLAVNGFTNHVHVFFELNPNVSTSKVLQVIKSNSSKWINENHLVSGRFEWQRGYGAFSYSRSQRDTVIKYIIEQENHHKKRSFKNEYLDLLKKYEIEFDEKYLFQFYE
ncbi:MAG: IS200/IS605 family transposase [Bacteroidales bacterium]|nr:IS200/IS605 family transposase [Bacteroidales bacterium]